MTDEFKRARNSAADKAKSWNYEVASLADFKRGANWAYERLTKGHLQLALHKKVQDEIQALKKEASQLRAALKRQDKAEAAEAAEYNAEIIQLHDQLAIAREALCFHKCTKAIAEITEKEKQPDV